jgi:methylphosphotriester-DNA--protein-cysteine methyltransferase
MEDDLSLDEMAHSVGLSAAHFARMFRKSTGANPHQFVPRQKLERAKGFCVLPMRESWTSPWFVASRPSSTLHRSFVTSGELARQSITRI